MTPTDQTPQETVGAVCPICGGTGYVRLHVPVGHPQFGKAVPCTCKQREIEDRRLGRLRQASNLDHLQSMTFDSFAVPDGAVNEIYQSLREARMTAEQFADEPTGWLLLSGPYGCGKTHLAAAIANWRIGHGMSALFVVVPDLLDYLRAAYAPTSPTTYDERFDQVRNAPVLILDDLGTQNATPWAAEKLYQILNYRYNAELPTVVTTNQSVADMDPRLASRLRDPRLVRALPIYAPDYRLQGRNESFGSLSLYSAMTFESLSDRRGEIEPKQSQSLRSVLRAASEYSEQPMGWLVLRGPYGVGKTHIAAAIANRVAGSGMTVLFVVTADLLDHLRATFQPASPVSYDQRFSKVRRAWLLVLDDLGSQNSTPWAKEKLFQILNYRYMAGLPTIMTVASHDWSDVDERLQSRLQDSTVCTLVDMELPSYRGARAPTRKRRTTRRRT